MSADAAPRVASWGTGLGVYVHWAFCRLRCPYCAFNIRTRAMDDAPWGQAFAAEVRRAAARTKPEPVLSVYFGGGTPSRAPLAVLAETLAAIDAAWGLARGAEITLEANPEDVTLAKARAWRGLGVNRVSLGVQAFDDATLRFLGRGHDAEQAKAACETLAATFAKGSLDLIVGLPDRDREQERQALALARPFVRDHVSVYQLEIEPRTAFAAQAKRGVLRLPREEARATLYADTAATLAAWGLPGYEVSNHARAREGADTAQREGADTAHAAQSVHNLLYWRSGSWIGLGPGAAGRLNLGEARWSSRAIASPRAWLDAAAGAGAGAGATRWRRLSAQAAAREKLLMGLRLAEGMPRSLASVDADALAMLLGEGLLMADPERLRVAPHARVLTDAIARELAR